MNADKFGSLNSVRLSSIADFLRPYVWKAEVVVGNQSAIFVVHVVNAVFGVSVERVPLGVRRVGGVVLRITAGFIIVSHGKMAHCDAAPDSHYLQLHRFVHLRLLR